MNLTYQDLLKPESELRQEAELNKDKQVSEQILQQQRNNWTSDKTTALYINQLEEKLVELCRQTIKKAVNIEVSDSSLRQQLIELNTLTKTINQLKYGRYVNE
jgi:hypothetical protein